MDVAVIGALIVEEYVGFLSKEETLMALVVVSAGFLVIVVPEFKLPLQTLSVIALVDDNDALGRADDEGCGGLVIASLCESVEFVVAMALPRCCFFFFAKSYMSPNMPANVLRRFFMVSSASSATEFCWVGF